MRAAGKFWIATGIIVLAIAGLGLLLLMQRGFSARVQPSAPEAWLARTLRHLSVPAQLRNLENPVAQTAEVMDEAKAHYADHCAICHGNNGKGQTEMGLNMYPRAPDMTLAATQSLSDGEIYAIINNGVRLSGMPAWGEEETDNRETWALVHFIRHLPEMTAAEARALEAMNPVEAGEFQQEREIEEFLEQCEGETLMEE